MLFKYKYIVWRIVCWLNLCIFAAHLGKCIFRLVSLIDFFKVKDLQTLRNELVSGDSHG